LKHTDTLARQLASEAPAYCLVLLLIGAISGFAQSTTSESSDDVTEKSSAGPPTNPRPQDPNQDKWQFQVTAYTFVARIGGRAGIGDLWAGQLNGSF